MKPFSDSMPRLGSIWRASRRSRGGVGRVLWRFFKREMGWIWGWWRRSLQLRTTIVTLLVASIAVGIVSVFLSFQIANALFQERLRQAESNTARAVNQVQHNFDGAQVTDKSSLFVIAKTTLSALTDGEQESSLPYLMVPINAQENPLSLSSLASDGLTLSIIADSLREAVHNDNSGMQFWQSIALPINARESHPAIAMGTQVSLSNTTYELYLIYDLERAEDTLLGIQSVLWIAGTALLLLVGGITWYVTRNVVKPVSQAARVAQKLAAGQLQERMQVHGEDEVARLGKSFNRMATALQDQITQMASLSQMQQNFVSDVSHELRTPLTTVRMAAQVLYEARDEFDAINRRSAELLYDQVERFQELLADLLEISRFDAGAAVLDAEPRNLLTMVEKVMETSRPLAERIGSSVQLLAQVPLTECIVEMDSRRIERVIRNLLVNALEHGEGKPIEIFLATNAHTAAVAVRDYGIGMDEISRSRVFDRFWRADPARARTTGGSGLGLAIALEDARLHHGRLDVWGEPGQGACFRLTLPRKRQGSVHDSPLPMPSGALPEEMVRASAAHHAVRQGAVEEPG